MAREREVSGKCASGGGEGLGELKREMKKWKSGGEDRFEREEGRGALLSTEFLLTRNRERAERRGYGSMARPKVGQNH